MLAHSIIFYFFSFITIASSLMVISSKNTVHAVFFLILDFVSISSLFIMLGAEFLGMLTLIVYVGAVAVLFLFVVMMINVNFSELKSGFLEYIPFGLVIGLVILLEVDRNWRSSLLSTMAYGFYHGGILVMGYIFNFNGAFII